MKRTELFDYKNTSQSMMPEEAVVVYLAALVGGDCLCSSERGIVRFRCGSHWLSLSGMCRCVSYVVPSDRRNNPRQHCSGRCRGGADWVCSAAVVRDEIGCT